MGFEHESVKQRLSALAKEGVFIGTSSWKYPGWKGTFYDEARYVYRKRFAKSRFEDNCLTEYAETFKTVGVDATYYKFPGQQFLEELASQVPEDFRFGFKVTEEITIKHFPNHPRAGARGGRLNEHFMNVDLFERGFLRPCEAIRSKVGILMFEFSPFTAKDYAKGSDFLVDLDRFLDRLPRGWPYGIELRNRQWLVPEYFQCLARYGVTHVFNSWTAMPPVAEQMALPGSHANPELVAARFLLKPGCKYEEAVNRFKPYEKLGEAYEEGRSAGRALIKEGKAAPKRKTLIFVNNRLEGNALESIAAMLEPEN